ncbi:MAG: 50S ribosomal protein L7/L12 [Anaerolineales bacterium]|nr:50S ribosomal protein L7/L12 [Anaerolineales bacterium]MCK5793185.1 50S ribosomal protein L7/L12 [Anaerolineales bacterium]
MADIKKIKEELDKLTVLEAAELVSMLEEEWGVSAAAPVAVAAVAAGGDGDAGDAKTEFDVVIKDTGPKKIEVIKAIRAITSLGLKDAKDMAEAADSKILEAAGKDAAEEAKKQLEEAGATVVLA